MERGFKLPKTSKRAARGEAPTVPGIGAPYEEPIHPEVIVDSEKLSPEECAQDISKKLAKTFSTS